MEKLTLRDRLIFAVGILGIAAVAGLPSADAADASKGKRVMYAQQNASHPYIAASFKAFRERAEQYGMEITGQAAGFDAALQNRQVDDAIARKFDLLVVHAVSEQAIIPSLARAKEAKIPVVLVSAPKDNTEEYYLTAIGEDADEMGVMAGHAIVNSLKASGRDGGKVALITGNLEGGIGLRRLAGIKKVLAETPKIQLVAVEDGRWNTATSERIAGQLFARFAAQGGLDAMYGMADNQAVAIIKAAEAARIKPGLNRDELIVVGGNCLKEGLDAIRANKLASSITQQPRELGIRAADAANAIFEGKSVPKRELIPTEIVEKDNLAKWEAACTY
jgi:ribose transport system substrate-binding protein